MTIAERDQIDMVVKAMNREYQQRALMNIDPDLIMAEAERRFKVMLDSINEIQKIERKYANVAWDIITLWKMQEEYKDAVGSIKK